MLTFSPIPALTDTMREFDRFFDDMLDRPRASSRLQPIWRYDWIQKKDAYVLTIEAERKATELNEGEKLITSRSSYGRYTQTFTIGEEIDAAHVDAVVQNGVLSLTLPRKEEAKAHKVQLRLGGGEEQKTVKAVGAKSTAAKH
jgi:HSP20 family molecular chaperone IbpA